MRDSDGTRLGRVSDLIIAIDTGEHRPLVTRLVIGSGRRIRLVDVHDLDHFDDDTIVLRSEARPVDAHRERGALALRNDELLLWRDVLDTQVVDLEGHRLARVADLALEQSDHGRLRVAGVDVGIGRVLTRLGLRHIGERRGERFIGWDDLHLTSSRGHDVQLAAPRAAVHRLDPAGLAALLERLDLESGTEVLRAVPARRAAEAIVSGHHRTGERLLRALPLETAHRIVGAIPHPHRRHWEAHLTRQRALRGRRFHRLRGWRRHHRAPA